MFLKQQLESDLYGHRSQVPYWHKGILSGSVLAFCSPLLLNGGSLLTGGVIECTRTQ